MAKELPLLIVYGWDFPCRRLVREIIDTKTKDGWQVAHVSGGDHEALYEFVNTSDVLVASPPMLLVVRDPEDAPLALLEAHATDTNPATVLLLHVEGTPDGRTKIGQWLKKQPKFTRSFEKPKDYALPKEAAAFAVQEASRLGKKLTSNLAEQLIERVGVDFGVVAFEIEKFVILANVTKTDTITAKIISAGMASLLPAMVGPVIDALAAKKTPLLAKALARVWQTNKSDPTMNVCRFVGESAIKWMQASYLEALPVNEAAREVGVHPYRYEQFILPAARRWGKEGTVRLVADLAAAERALLSGCISPWNVLSTRLLAACVGLKDEGGSRVLVEPVRVEPPPVRVVPSPPVKLLMPTFVLPFEQAHRVPVQPEWWERVQRYIRERNEKKSAKAHHAERGGNPVDEDEMFGKVAEYAVEHWFREVHGLPRVEVDVEVRVRKVGWRPDLIYTEFGGPAVHVKTSYPKDLVLPDKSVTFQWCDEPDKWTHAKAKEWGGCDDIFTHRADPGPGWRAETTSQGDRFAIWGTTSHDDHVVGTWTEVQDGVPTEVLIYFSVPWKFLLETGQLQPPFFLKGYTKGCTRLSDMLAAWNGAHS